MLEKGRSQTMDDGRIEILFLENGRNQLMIYYITTTNLLYYKTLGKLTWERMFSELKVRITTYHISADSACHGE